MLETIEADADRVTRLITELLDVSRIDAGRLNVRREPVDLHALVERHVERLGRRWGSAEQRVRRRRRATDRPDMWADPDRLDQIVANLLENAVTPRRRAVRSPLTVGTVDRGARTGRPARGRA